MELNDDELNVTEINGPPAFSSPETTHDVFATDADGHGPALTGIVAHGPALMDIVGST